MAFHYIQNIIPLPYHSLEGPLWYKPSLSLRQSLPCLVLLTSLWTRSPFYTSISTVCLSSSGLLHLHIPLPESFSSQIFVFLFYSDFHSNITFSRRKPHAVESRHSVEPLRFSFWTKALGSVLPRKENCLIQVMLTPGSSQWWWRWGRRHLAPLFQFRKFLKWPSQP